MKATIKRFGKEGMHIYIPAKAGYIVGQEVELTNPIGVAKAPTREEIQRMIDLSIQKAKEGY